jgi:tRNA(Arg) A34 adenosine deaminase TadA
MQGNPIFMEKAIALATENVTSGRGGPFGGVMVRDGKVIATGVNLVTATNDPTAHAEVTAIRNTSTDAVAAGFDDAFLYEEAKLPLSQRRIPMINLLREQAISNFEAWRKYAGRIDY